MRIAYLLTAVLISLPAFAQKYEFGVHGGISFYDKKTVTNSRGNADAGFNTGYGAGVHHRAKHVQARGRRNSLHVPAERNEARVRVGQGDVWITGSRIHYDFLIHGTGRNAAVRPYVAFGGGIKYFRGTGTEQVFQPLSNIALLTKAYDTKGLASVGGGVKLKLTRPVWLRVDVHDYLTPFRRTSLPPQRLQRRRLDEQYRRDRRHHLHVLSIM